MLNQSRSVGNVDAEVDVVVGRLRGGLYGGRVGSNAGVSGSDGWLEGIEELHNDGALDVLEKGLLKCDAANIWLVLHS